MLNFTGWVLGLRNCDDGGGEILTFYLQICVNEAALKILQHFQLHITNGLELHFYCGTEF